MRVGSESLEAVPAIYGCDLEVNGVLRRGKCGDVGGNGHHFTVM